MVARGQEERPLTPRERAVHLLSRLSFGPTAAEVERVLEMGEEAWLEEQLAPGPDPELERRLVAFPTLELSAGELVARYRAPRDSELSAEERREANRLRHMPRQELVAALLLRAIHGRWQLQEVLADFWRNHFNVSFTKGGAIEMLVTGWDRDVIRAHALGRFGELLDATAHHPAMLVYLDNWLSRRPATRRELERLRRRTRQRTGSEAEAAAAVALAEQRGLNENYARELLELHTLGVDNGYSQQDVVALARILTGWTVRRGRDEEPEFLFAASLHDAGDKRFLGRILRTDPEDGEAEGRRALELLAGHRNTSEFVAGKLVRHLVADAPPPRLVAAVARTFRKSRGDVRAMLRTIVASEEFWSRAAFRAKFRTPLQLVVATLRVTGAEVERPEVLLQILERMAQPPYHCDPPTGWPDTAEAWLDPGVLALRWQLAAELVAGGIPGVRIPDSLYAGIPEDQPPRLWQHHLTARILPGGAAEATRDALAAAVGAFLAASRRPRLRELGPQLVALLLGSPEFQQR